MSAQLLLFSLKKSSRYTYITNLIYKDLLGFEQISYSYDWEEFVQAENFVKVNYSNRIGDRMLSIPKVSELLWEQGVKVQFVEIEWEKTLPFAFGTTNTDSKFSFDLYAFCFYLVTRYEEYLPFEADEHQRFPARASLAYQNDFLQMPVVNIWVEKLRKALADLYPNYSIPPQSVFSYQPSYDIDYAWMYKYKGWKRQIGGLGRDLLKIKPAKVGERLAVLSNQKADPYFTFDYLDALHAYYPQLKPLYFWLLGDYGPYDKNVNPNSKVMQELIERHQQQYEMGIHPSYASNHKNGQLEKEIERLERITNGEILISRQHFLKLNFPSTYRALKEVGIKADYSMGYADQIGFRASIASSFYWYDLEKEEKTDLRIHPFMFMDVTLNRYMKISSDLVLKEVAPIIDATKSVGGELMTIWHNNSFSELEGWEGWRKVYEEILEYIGGKYKK